MTRNRLWFLLAAAVGLTVLGAVAYTAFRQPLASPPAAGVPAGPAAVARPAGGPGGPGAGGFPVPVEVTAVTARALADSTTTVGTLRASESVMLRPETAGRIVALPFREGQPVAAGTVLVELDNAIQKAELLQAQANRDLAQSNQRRAEELFGKAFVARSALDEAAANLKAAEAQVALAEARLARTRIRAPFAGTAGIRSVSVGDFVKEGQDLVNLEDIDRLKVDFRLPEADAPKLAAGQPLRVESDTVPGRRFEARVSAIDPQIDAAGRSLRVRAELVNRERLLRPGMFVRVTLDFATRDGVLLVPEAALVPFGSEQFVFRLAADAADPQAPPKAERVPVAIGVRRDGLVEIRSGVAAGDRVVVAGQLKLRPGAAVKPLTGEADGAAGPAAGGAASAAPTAGRG
jgi:membrane fusion protein (multidrug efflux system)